MKKNRKYVEVESFWSFEKGSIKLPLDTANTISCMAHQSAQYNEMMGCVSIARENQRFSDLIYKELESIGYFDE